MATNRQQPKGPSGRPAPGVPGGPTTRKPGSGPYPTGPISGPVYPTNPGLPPRTGGAGSGRLGGPIESKPKPVGYGRFGRPFYDINAYRRSAAFRQGKSGGPQRPHPPEQPLAQGNRLAGVSHSFPHTGAAAVPGTADQHINDLRGQMLSGEF